MEKLLAFALPKFTLLTIFIKKPLLVIAGIPAIVAVSQVVSYEGVWVIFTCFIIGDLLSGLGASYCQWKAKPNRKEHWFFGKGEGFSSDKAKKMGIKLLVYLIVPQLIVNIQKTLLLKNFKYSTISDAEFELATIVVLFFCAVEGFSIVHENLPKCGIDLWGSLKKMIGFIKEVKSEITK
jgi:hypothetical protein